MTDFYARAVAGLTGERIDSAYVQALGAQCRAETERMADSLDRMLGLPVFDDFDGRGLYTMPGLTLGKYEIETTGRVLETHEGA